MMPKRKDELPRVRFGHCCGKDCKEPDQTLYRIWPLERWRCATCFKKETGYQP